MITGVKSNEPRISGKTTKGYYVIMDDGNPVGVCTEKDANLCLNAYASSKKAIHVFGENVYLYDGPSGTCCITIRKVPRMKMAR